MESDGLVRSSGRFSCPCSRLFSYPIMLPGRYDAPGVLASDSGLAASA